jgi:hypothetical protein
MYLPSSIMSSLKKFHTCFHIQCRRLFPAEILFENCCEEFESSFQHREDCSYNSEEENEFTNEEILQVRNVGDTCDSCSDSFNSFDVEDDFSYQHDGDFVDLDPC